MTIQDKATILTELHEEIKEKTEKLNKKAMELAAKVYEQGAKEAENKKEVTLNYIINGVIEGHFCEFLLSNINGYLAFLHDQIPNLRMAPILPQNAHRSGDQVI